MIYGIGIDAVELVRISDIITRNPKFINRVLTARERLLFDQLGSHKRQTEFLAGRFACKEAFSKAYGTGIGKVTLRDIEILKHDNGSPYVSQSPFDGRAHVSITHTDTTAVAQIILEKK
ncbi:holo-ACP synthase [Vagococcus acidifermentans]|uniref:Holo-[acyl-carrier-protein] synthase n=1 Tax=Vagococcus acidifermentans TaxID=564710 RepID=A0A430AUT4_9ENTE|nr:holo-ACP synthase [Vagococcus acidifermentans]RSU11811.1 holo-ACP synthase [Vagococcus acidifermentans]